MTIGRNDPCHCGSGIKYKKCCLQKDVAGDSRIPLDFEYESHLRLRGETTDKLDELIIKFATKEMLEEYKSVFWICPFLLKAEREELLSDDEALHTLDQTMVFSLQASLIFEEKSPAQYFLEKYPNRFTSPQLEYLKGIVDARFTFLQLREMFPEAGYTIAEDIFDGTLFKIFDKNISRQHTIHSIVSGRLVSLDPKEGFVLESLGSCVIVHNLKEPLIELLQEYETLLNETNQPKSRRHKSYLNIHQILKKHPLIFYWIDMWVRYDYAFAHTPTLTNTDGHEILYIRARYSCNDFNSLTEKLLAHKNFDLEDEDNPDTFVWVNQKDYLIGTLVMNRPKGEIVVEVNSDERFRKWKKLLPKFDELQFLEKTEQTMEAVQKLEKEKAVAPLSVVKKNTSPQNLKLGNPNKIEPETLLQMQPQIEKMFADRWVSERIPALGNLTPVQAAATPASRKKLIDLLDSFEYQNANLPPGMMGGFNVDKMRKRLGLAES